ncbi:DNA double-strand break repair Rad50 ATPase, putative [Pediculus humanus corporis]|uniref:DNA double-strand break repair Rad50 ATPase, putative n=1 Tax=Pediculus humanus subsp. corporis TaxID=121224 RepID=E0VV77_PEDHC|nr:DNA double-strand break repair Rad50 ATPase, putative [Pediculus humanus corporis]EEB17283.1 DNA double-strand break repair Rad50 ATPase, putative [Pediculus humanus corporis]
MQNENNLNGKKNTTTKLNKEKLSSYRGKNCTNTSFLKTGSKENLTETVKNGKQILVPTVENKKIHLKNIENDDEKKKKPLIKKKNRLIVESVTARLYDVKKKENFESMTSESSKSSESSNSSKEIEMNKDDETKKEMEINNKIREFSDNFTQTTQAEENYLTPEKSPVEFLDSEEEFFSDDSLNKKVVGKELINKLFEYDTSHTNNNNLSLTGNSNRKPGENSFFIFKDGARNENQFQTLFSISNEKNSNSFVKKSDKNDNKSLKSLKNFHHLYSIKENDDHYLNVEQCPNDSNLNETLKENKIKWLNINPNMGKKYLKVNIFDSNKRQTSPLIENSFEEKIKKNESTETIFKSEDSITGNNSVKENYTQTNDNFQKLRRVRFSKKEFKNFDDDDVDNNEFKNYDDDVDNNEFLNFFNESYYLIKLSAQQDKIRLKTVNDMIAEMKSLRKYSNNLQERGEKEKLSFGINEEFPRVKRFQINDCVKKCKCEKFNKISCSCLWPKEFNSTFELNTFGPGSNHCYQFCIFCRKKDEELYCSTPSLNTIKLLWTLSLFDS